MSEKKVSIVSGCQGQVGSYLCEELLNRGYEVHGLIRRSSNYNTQRIDHIFDKVKLHYAELSDEGSICDVITKVKPTHFFNLAAQSHVAVSWVTPLASQDYTGTGVLRILEVIRKYSPETKFIQSGSSEMFGGLKDEPITLDTKFYPRSPYAASKTYGHYSVINHRESYNLFASNLIMFNCESPRRGENFVTRKVTRAATRIKLGLQDKLILGNPDAKRDWGFAGDYVDAFIRVAEADKPDDYIVATGENHSIREFVEIVFAKLDLDYTKYVEFNNPQYIRPAEVNFLLGDASKIKNDLGWMRKTSFDELVNMMVNGDLKLASQEKILKGIK